MKLIAWLIGGFVFSLAASLLCGVAESLLFTLTTRRSHLPIFAVSEFIVAEVVAIVLVLTAPTAGKAWRRLLIASGVMCLLLPLAGLVPAGALLTEPATRAGDGVAGGIATAFAGLVGFFLGAILLVAGLLCGRSARAVAIG